MRALCWHGVNDLRVGTVADPEIVNPHDAVIRVRLSTHAARIFTSSTATCRRCGLET